mmetsp:Transcript_9175/g.20704  ORF Transcript_9175/g.20704 Transcript_9175/m.20704 type:complete len:239 (+) Transcript_9175:164-880(+)
MPYPPPPPPPPLEKKNASRSDGRTARFGWWGCSRLRARWRVRGSLRGAAGRQLGGGGLRPIQRRGGGEAPLSRGPSSRRSRAPPWLSKPCRGRRGVSTRGLSWRRWTSFDPPSPPLESCEGSHGQKNSQDLSSSSLPTCALFFLHSNSWEAEKGAHPERERKVVVALGAYKFFDNLPQRGEKGGLKIQQWTCNVTNGWGWAMGGHVSGSRWRPASSLRTWPSSVPASRQRSAPGSKRP